MHATFQRMGVACFASVLLLSAGCGKGKEAAQPVASAAPEASAAAAPAGPPPDVKESIDLDGAKVDTVHTKLDTGRVQDLFDDSPVSLGRTQNAQTFLLDMTFPQPRRMKGIAVTTGTMDVGLKVALNGAASGTGVYSKELRNGGADPTVTLDFGGVQEVREIRIEVTNLQGGDGHVHVREVKLEEAKAK